MLNEDELRDAALLVFANKQDQSGAKGAGEISEALRLGELRDRNWSIVACSAVDGKGVSEGMDWLVVTTSTICFTCSARLTSITSKPSIPNHELKLDAAVFMIFKQGYSAFIDHHFCNALRIRIWPER